MGVSLVLLAFLDRMTSSPAARRLVPNETPSPPVKDDLFDNLDGKEQNYVSESVIEVDRRVVGCE